MHEVDDFVLPVMTRSANRASLEHREYSPSGATSPEPPRSLERASPAADATCNAIFGDFFASCICSEPCAARFRPASEIRTKAATPCVEVWQTSSLRRLRLGEERKKTKRKKKPQGKNIMVCSIP